MDKALAMKIWKVMDAIDGVEKGMIVGKGTKGEYKAVGEADALNVIKPLLREHKLICLPTDGTITEHVDIVENYNKTSTRSITQLKVFFNLIDAETGESVQIVGFGNGADSQDKGSGKAFTYAYKTALQKSFCMFSGEDTDGTHSQDINPDPEKQEVKVTTAMLEEAIEASPHTVEQILATYKKDTGKSTDKIKFIKQDYKQTYYNMLMEGK